MKKGKRIVSILLALVMCLSLQPMPALAAEGEDSGTITPALGEKLTLEAVGGTDGFENEGCGNLVDGKITAEDGTKWCLSFNSEGAYVILRAASAVVISGYSFTTGNDNAKETGRNPESWTLYGSDSPDGAWTQIVSVDGDTTMHDENYTQYDFVLTTAPAAYQYYKFEFRTIKSGSVMQLSEIALYGPSCEHDWQNEGEAVAATCTEGGYQLQKCSRCGASKKTDITTALDHDWQEAATTPATCIENGHTDYKCSRCEATKQDIIYATGHQYVDGICSECGQTKHAHPICGAACSHEGTHGNEIDWQEASALPNDMEAGNYYLTGNVILTDTWTPAANVTLCLNGHSITAEGNFDAIAVNENITLTLCDCGPDGAGGTITHSAKEDGTKYTGRGVIVQENGVFTMYGGTITGCEVSGDFAYGGGVYVGYQGVFTMNGGTITGCEVSGDFAYGGGVYVDDHGVFTMNGGTIVGCETAATICAYGGGVYVYDSGTFTLNCGTIARCKANSNDEYACVYGGGVLVYGIFTMNGGSITGNSAIDAGGVYVDSNSQFTLKGGSIIGNSATQGGGVYVYNSGTFTMDGGEICGNSGSVGGGVGKGLTGKIIMKGGSITGNSAIDAGGGMYVQSVSDCFTLNGGSVTGNFQNGAKNDETGRYEKGGSGADDNVYLDSNACIAVGGPLKAGTNVGVTTAAKPTAEITVLIAINANDNDTAYIHSDDDSYVAVYRYGEIYLYLKPCEDGRHTFVKGRCTKCGYDCPHKDYSSDGVCSVCKIQAEAAVINGETVEYCLSVYDAMLAAQSANGYTLKLLTDVQNIDVSAGSFTIDLNGKKVDSLRVVENASGIKLTNAGSIAGSIGTLDISDSGVTLESLLEEGYAFVSDGHWYSADELAEKKSLSNVSVRQIPQMQVTADKESYTYGESIILTASVTETNEGGTIACQWYEVKSGQDTLLTGSESTLTITKPASGSYTYKCVVNVQGYELSETVTVTVNKVDLSGAEVVLEQSSFVYDGSAKTPTVTEVKLGGKALTKDTDYDVTVTSQTDAGSYDVTVNGKGNYTGMASASWSITPKAVTNPTIELSGTSFTYDGGKAITPTVTVKDGETVIPADEYTVSYTNNTNAGTATVTVTGKDDGNYTVSGSTTFTIKKASFDAPAVTMSEYTYGSTLPTPGIGSYPGGGTVTYYYNTTNSIIGGTEWKDMTATRLDAGTYYMYAVIAESMNYTGATTRTVEFTVSAAAAPVTNWPTVSGTVYVNDKALADHRLTGGTADVDGCFTITDATKTWAESGEKQLKVTFTPTGSNYSAVEQEITVNVIKRTITAVAAQTDITGKPFLTEQSGLGLPTEVTITTADGKTFENVSVAWSGYDRNTLEEQTLTGTLDLTAISAEVQQPEKAVTASVRVKLDAVTLPAVTFADKTATYTGEPIANTLTAPDGVAAVEYEYEGKDGTVYEKSETAPTDAGSYTVTAAFTMDYGYNQLASATATLNINKADITAPVVTANDLTYDGNDQALVTVTGNADGGTMQYSLNNQSWQDTIPVGKAAGSYTVHYRIIGDGNHNSTAPASVTVNIAPAKVTVTAKDKSAYVNDKAPDLSKPEKDKDYTVSGLIGEDTLTGGVTLAYDGTPDMTKSGETAIRTGGTLANGNYDVVYVDGRLTVTASPSSDDDSTAPPASEPETKPAETEPETKPAETKPETKPAETEPETKPTETKPETKPAETKPAETKPAETKPETKPAETRPETKPAETKPADTEPARPGSTITVGESTLPAEAKVNGNTVTVDIAEIDKLGDVVGGANETVSIDLSAVEGEQTIDTVELPAEMLEKLAAGGGDTKLEISLPGGAAVGLNAAALNGKVTEAGGGKITISIKSVEDGALTAAQVQSIDRRPAFDVNLFCGDVRISAMGSEITLRVPYTLADGETAEGIRVYFVAEDGRREACETLYDTHSGEVTWKTTHLSVYMIDHETADEASTEELIAESGSSVGLWIVIGVAALAAVAVIVAVTNTKKKRSA